MPKNEATLQRLREVAVAVWEELKVALLRKLIDSMVRRLEAVIKADGWYTKY
jgi:hypothetical protein